MDGNGRIGRLLISLCSARRDFFLTRCCTSVRSSSDTVTLLQSLLGVSQSLRWAEWIQFFLRGVSEQATDAIDRAHRLLELRERFRRQFHEARSSALLLKLIDELFNTPIVTIPRAMKILRVTYHSAQGNIERLIEEAFCGK